MVVAVSGRSGKPLWNYLIDRKPTDLPAEALDHGISYISQAKGSFVAVIDGSKWIGLDPATGRLRGPSIDLGFAPVQPIQYADLDGDGSAEILALEPQHRFRTLDRPDAGGILGGDRKAALGQKADVLLQTNARGSGARLAGGGRPRRRRSR